MASIAVGGPVWMRRVGDSRCDGGSVRFSDGSRGRVDGDRIHSADNELIGHVRGSHTTMIDGSVGHSTSSSFNARTDFANQQHQAFNFNNSGCSSSGRCGLLDGRGKPKRTRLGGAAPVSRAN